MFKFLVFLCFFFSLAAGEKNDDASVKCLKKDKKIHCSITFLSSFKLNEKAPFRFSLKSSEDENFSAPVAADDFSCKDTDSGIQCKHISKTVADIYDYWFVACKYEENKIVACKTFSGTKRINREDN